jgi:hypothetical protein
VEIDILTSRYTTDITLTPTQLKDIEFRERRENHVLHLSAGDGSVLLGHWRSKPEGGLSIEREEEIFEWWCWLVQCRVVMLTTLFGDEDELNLVGCDHDGMLAEEAGGW